MKKKGQELPVAFSTEENIALQLFIARVRYVQPCGQSEATQLATEAAFARRAAAAFVKDAPKE